MRAFLLALACARDRRLDRSPAGDPTYGAPPADLPTKLERLRPAYPETIAGAAAMTSC